MTSEILQKLVDEDFGLEGRGKWYHAIEHDSFVVNAEDGTWFWNSRGIRGDALDYLIQIRGYSKEQARDFLKNFIGAFRESPDDIPKSTPYERLVDIMWDNGKHERTYWYERCLSDSTIDRYRLGHYNGWSLIPIYDNGEFSNFQMRRDVPQKRITRWYRDGKTTLFNDGILPFTKTIYITEGTVDAILLNQEGLPAVSPNGTNTWQQEWFRKFSHIENIYYVEDNDKAGRVGAKLVAKSLGMDRVKIISYLEKPEKYDTVDLFKDGGNVEIFKQYVDNSKYIYQLEDVYEQAKQIRRNEYFAATRKGRY